MGFRIIIAGETQCTAFAESCLLADYLSQNLPNFCYNSIEKTVKEWKAWLCKVNIKYKWHHMESPIIWKEMLMKGSKPFYIGGASDFLDYCYSYYNFDSLFASEKYDGLLENVLQFKRAVHAEEVHLQTEGQIRAPIPKNNFVFTVTGAGHILAMHLISALLCHEITESDKIINKVYLHDDNCSEAFMNFVEKECYYVQANYPGKIVKYIDKLGMALTNTDVLIVLDHEPYNEANPIGEWLGANRRKMEELAHVINASGSRSMYILFPNLGPACYNATILRNCVNINKSNIAVATSDVGLEILPIVATIAQVPMRNIFCPPVWGFVGINKLVDIRTTVHKYNTFDPYTRYTKVKNSTLNIGSITPELRTLDYLMHFDESLWIKVAEAKSEHSREKGILGKAVAVTNLINLWLLNPSPDHVVCLGISCDGSFGLHFDGIFSQPARFVDGAWVPATDFLMPRDPQMKLHYLEKMANYVMSLKRNDLPEIIPYHPCVCKKKVIKNQYK